MTDTSKAGQGVIDAAFSPDGKTMAVAELGKDGRAELVFAKPDDLLLSDAKPQGVPACKAIWRPDGRSSSSCRPMTASPRTGELVRIRAENPNRTSSRSKLDGDNPVFQPLPSSRDPPCCALTAAAR